MLLSFHLFMPTPWARLIADGTNAYVQGAGTKKIKGTDGKGSTRAKKV